MRSKLPYSIGPRWFKPVTPVLVQMIRFNSWSFLPHLSRTQDHPSPIGGGMFAPRFFTGCPYELRYLGPSFICFSDLYLLLFFLLCLGLLRCEYCGYICSVLKFWTSLEDRPPILHPSSAIDFLLHDSLDLLCVIIDK